MTDTFIDYHEARREAQACANAALPNSRDGDIGIEKMRQFGQTVYRVFRLPRPENRYGFELRCEVVTPMRRVTL